MSCIGLTEPPESSTVKQSQEVRLASINGSCDFPNDAKDFLVWMNWTLAQFDDCGGRRKRVLAKERPKSFFYYFLELTATTGGF